MNRKITKLNNKMYDVITPEEYAKSPDIYNSTFTALSYDELGVVLPIRNRLDIVNEVGVYPTREVNIINTQNINEDYSSNRVLDLNSGNMREVLSKSEVIKSMESEILTSSDNVYCPKIREEDSPALKAIKNAAGMKSCDLDSYAYRFGSNYNNDIRHLKNLGEGKGKKVKISLDKLVSIADKLDMSVQLVIEDKSPDVPNPMKDKVVVLLNGTEEEGDK